MDKLILNKFGFGKFYKKLPSHFHFEQAILATTLHKTLCNLITIGHSAQK
jgi:hypothetical protein